MHKLLERQLKRQFGTLEAVPTSLRPLLDAIDATYNEADEERRMVDRSLELTSQELMERNAALREREQKLNEAYDRLQTIDLERMQFLNNAAHELGTPLTPIQLQVHLIKSRLEAKGHPEQRKSVEMLERNFDRLSALVRDLLDAARLQASALKLHVQPLDLRDVVCGSVENYLGAARQAGVILEVDEIPSLPVVADPLRLGQVFDNILSNAVKFTPRGAHIQVSAEAQDGKAVVHLADQGHGMRPDDLQRLFKPFTQVHDTMAEPHGGTGLGLYVSRGIVQALGGTISAESGGLGNGSTFTVTLPLVSAPTA